LDIVVPKPHLMNQNKWAKGLQHPEVLKAQELIKTHFIDRLEFVEESHQYFLDGKELECVSNIVSRWSSSDEEAMLDNVCRKAAVDSSYKYYGKTRQEIQEAWRENARRACEFGSKCHAFGEEMFYYATGQRKDEPIPTCEQEKAIVKFWEDLPSNYIPVMAEAKVFSTDYHPYAGTFDILFYYINEADPSQNCFIIFDYKTNVSLTNLSNRKWGNRMLAPFNELIEEAQSHYLLQLSLYQIPLESLGLKVSARRLIWLRPDGTYEKVKLNDMTESKHPTKCIL